jgi:hypothetical protein
MTLQDTPFPPHRRYSVISKYGVLIAAAVIALDHHVADRVM